MSEEAVLSALRAALGPDSVATGAADLTAYSRDLWPKLTVGHRDRQPTPPPLAVVRPQSEDEAQTVLDVLTKHGVSVVPYGSGSGVCGGAAPLFGGVVVDLKGLDELGEVDPATLQVECGPGLNLQNLERLLNDGGYTLGHFPSSIYCASIGGCVAARGAGQLSSRYGKIEDMVTGLRVATPDLGVVSTGSLDPSAPGTDWSPLFIGSEGTLGLITRIRLRVHPLPQTMVLRGVRFPSVEAGLNAFREILQSGMRPSVMRLYDPLDTWMAMQKANDAGGAAPVPGAGDPLAGSARERRSENAVEPGGVPPDDAGSPRFLGSVVSPGTLASSVFGRLKRRGRRHRSVKGDSLLAGVAEKLVGDRLKDLLKPENLPAEKLLANPALLNRAVDLLPGRCLAIFGCEGDPETARQELEGVVAAAARLGGVDLGPGPGEQWFRTRYHVSFKLPKLLRGGAFADTFETAAPWSRVPALYAAVRRAVAPHVLVMAHMSHAYHEGCSIYFTLAGHHATVEGAQRLYERAWDAAMAAAQSVGAVLSHHHGIGVLKKGFMDAEHGDSRRLFEAARDAVDGKRVLNPGKLFPDAVPAPGPVRPDPKPQELVVHAHQDGVIEAGVDWRGIDLAAELSLRGHFLPPLGREFLLGTVQGWLQSPAVGAHVAIHGAWEHPLLAVEGRYPDGRAWCSGALPRAATGPGYLPFMAGSTGARPVSVTLRTLTPPAQRPVGMTWPNLDAAVKALQWALRGLPRPFAGMVFPGPDPLGFRTILQDGHSGADGAVTWLLMADPDGFPGGTEAIIARLKAAGGKPVGHDEGLAWWEDHWAQPAREGAEALPSTGPLADEREIGTCTAVVPWRKALLLLRSVETLTGGRNRAAGWIEAPLETGCTVRWRFTASRAGAEAPALVPWQLRETIRACGARIAHLDLRGSDLPEGTFGGRGTPAEADEGPRGDAQRLEARLADTLKARTP